MDSVEKFSFIVKEREKISLWKWWKRHSWLSHKLLLLVALRYHKRVSLTTTILKNKYLWYLSFNVFRVQSGSRDTGSSLMIPEYHSNEK